MRFLGWAAFLLLLSPLVMADADRQDWIGEYGINHDGHPGTLRITQGKCRRGLPCTGLAVQYADENGTEYRGSVLVVDENGQHMRFTINFPGNAQIFDVYIFSFDKSKLAGTTLWGGRTFGVMAQKRVGHMPAGLTETVGMAGHVPKPKVVVRPGEGLDPTGIPTRSLLPDGTIQLRYADGSVKTKRVGQCGWSTLYPDGHTQEPMCVRAEVIPIVPPPPPSGSPEERWLELQDNNLLAIIQTVLGGTDSTDYKNYLHNYENPPDPVLYKRIYYRTQAIAELTSTPH